MWRLLTTISWRHARHHRLRTILTFFGIALGVAVIVAVGAVNRSLTTSFQSTIDQIAGKAVLQVANGESGIDENLSTTIRDTPGVENAAPAVEGFLPVASAPGERLYVYGVDFLTDSTMREHQFSQGINERMLHWSKCSTRDNNSEAGNRGLKLNCNIESISENNHVIQIITLGECAGHGCCSCSNI